MVHYTPVSLSFYASADDTTRRILCFHHVPTSRYPSRANTGSFALDEHWTDLEDSWDGNHYHQQINWVHIERNYTTDKVALRQKIQIDVKAVLSRSKWLHTLHSTYSTLHLQGWRVHYTLAATEASYDHL